MAEDWAHDINGDEDDDEALRLAIAMSLGQEPSKKETLKQQPVLVDLTQDDVETASEASSPGLHGVNAEPVETPEPVSQKTGPVGLDEERSGYKVTDLAPVGSPAPVSSPTPVSISEPVSSRLSLLGLDRKKMEEERLARNRKRKATEEGLAHQGDSKRTKNHNNQNQPNQPIDTAGGQGAQSRQAAQQQSRTRNEAELLPPQPASSSSAQHNPTAVLGEKKPAQQKQPGPGHDHANLPYPKGVVKRTWVMGQPRLGDDIRIGEVLNKDDLELAIISSFQWDQDWLFKVIDVRKTKLVLVAMGGDEDEQEALRASVQNRIKFCFPPLHGPGNMHSKLQILKFPKYLRIVVPTGNFVPYDWGETGVMENMVFIIDLPRIDGGDGSATVAARKLTPFAEDLTYFLEAQGLDSALINSLAKYDFSETARYGFVHTIAGSHAQDTWQRTGYCGLGRTVHGLGLSTAATVDVDIVCSSLGAVTYDFLQMMYNACQGDSGLREYESRTAPKSKKNMDTASVTQRLERLRSHVRVYFPSEATIAQSRGGKDNAGTIFFHSRWWNQTTFPKVVLRDCKSKRPGILMHSKVLYVRTNPVSASSAASAASASETAPTAGFAYVGSANLSESAWGRLVKDKASGNPKMTCRNWECGVVVPVPRTSGGGKTWAGDGGQLGMFDGYVPVPMQTPGAPYVGASGSPGDSVGGLGKVLLRPWCLA